MNIALEQTEEHVNGTVTNRYGDAFIRGNNGPSAPLCICLRYCLLTSLCTQYSIYQLQNPCEFIVPPLLELATMRCGSFYAKLPGSLNYLLAILFR